MATYYIDNINGNDFFDGFSLEKAKKDYKTIDVKPGDIISFKRGSFYREPLNIVGGSMEAPVTYTAYGEGNKPVFCISFDVSDKAHWVAQGNNIWKCTTDIVGDVANFVFNENDCSATLRWDKNELVAQGDFWDSKFGDHNAVSDNTREILMYSEGNPTSIYSHIECVAHNMRVIAKQQNYIIIENIHFRNSGVHAIAGQGRGVTIRNCEFMNIGGCVWDKNQKIRFGNGVEFWTYGEDILIENCYFKNIYDSCVTHQGPDEKTIPTRNFICRNNIFDTYGMAAFEYRDKMPIASYFMNNICLNAGCGFAMLGEELPRYSEIWPQPMGHHIFLWRIPGATKDGSLKIRNNIFGNAPVGAAIYSIISPEAEAQIKLNNNIYLKSEKVNGDLLNHFLNRDFNDLHDFQKTTKKDQNSIYINRL
ncbi:MAG: hypothetical protein E7385_00535 [Ruminococcaceae bacterium]|nr:hypothetical protein [Oscillospiraceae bacterium]